MNAFSNVVLDPSLFDNAIIDISVFGDALNIKFEPSDPDVVRVNFSRNGLFTRSEGVPPFALAGDNPPGNYFVWVPVSGATYTIEAKGLNSSNQVVETKTITISFCSGCSACAGVCENQLVSGAPGTSSFELVDSNANYVFSPALFDNVVVDKAVFGYDLSIKFNPSDPSVGSVTFTETPSTTGPVVSQTENVVPYALRGDINSNYKAWNPPVDDYNIKAEVFEVFFGAGQSIESQEITVSICDGCYAACCSA